MNTSLSIEVCYARADEQTLIALTLPCGATVRDAIAASEITRKHPEIDPATAKLGIFGKLTTLDAPLNDLDRVEIYRPSIRSWRASAGWTRRAAPAPSRAANGCLRIRAELSTIDRRGAPGAAVVTPHGPYDAREQQRDGCGFERAREPHVVDESVQQRE